MVIGIGTRSVGGARASSRPQRRRPGVGRQPGAPASGPRDAGSGEELPRSIRRAAGLESFADEAIALAPPARAAAAARAFASGNGYLAGLIVDRLA